MDFRKLDNMLPDSIACIESVFKLPSVVRPTQQVLTSPFSRIVNPFQGAVQYTDTYSSPCVIVTTAPKLGSFLPAF